MQVCAGEMPMHLQAQAGRSWEGVKLCSAGETWCEKNAKELT